MIPLKLFWPFSKHIWVSFPHCAASELFLTIGVLWISKELFKSDHKAKTLWTFVITKQEPRSQSHYQYSFIHQARSIMVFLKGQRFALVLFSQWRRQGRVVKKSLLNSRGVVLHVALWSFGTAVSNGTIKQAPPLYLATVKQGNTGQRLSEWDKNRLNVILNIFLG